MRVLMIVLGILAVGAAAFLLGRNEGAAPPERGSQRADGDRGGAAGVDGAALERLSRSVEALQASVERLTRRFDEWSDRGESRPGAAQDRIIVDRFTLEAGPGARPVPAITPPTVQAAPDPERRKRFEDIRGKDFLEVNRKHWFWSYEDAVQHYGPPDEINPVGDSRMDFIYRFGTRDAHLQFYGGRLLVINWHQ